MNNIYVLQLISGENIVAKVSDSGDGYILKNAVAIVPQPGPGGQVSFGFMPYPVFGDKDDLKKNGMYIGTDKVITKYAPNTMILNHYNAAVGSNIIVPNKPSLIME